jgi:predicted O-methyltransferase YrrM
MNALQKAARLGWNLLRIVVTNPQRLHYVLGMTLAATEDVADRSADLAGFPLVTVDDLLPEAGLDQRATLALFPKTSASVSVLEFLALILLLKKARAQSVFEFGTYKGVSISQLALNLPDGARICTLDLPDDDPRSAFPISIAKDASIAREKGKGSLVPGELRGRIQFLQQDSALFDERPCAGTFDFVFVDGAHNTEYVRNDSEKGWRMLRSGGIMAWHDCCIHDREVVRYLRRSPFRPSRVLGTSLAFAIKP